MDIKDKGLRAFSVPFDPLVRKKAFQLAGELVDAYLKDEDPEVGGFDISAGMFGPNVSDWLYSMADRIAGGPEDKDG